MSKNISFAEKCRQANINYGTAYSYKRYHPELTEEQIISYCISKKDKVSLKHKCDSLGIDYEKVRGFKKAHKELNIEQIIELFASGKQKEYVKKKALKRKKQRECLSKNNIQEKAYRERSNIKVNGRTFRNLPDMLIYYSINDKYETIRRYINKHPEKTYEEVLKLYNAIEPIDKSELLKLKELCREKGIAYKSAHKFMKYHKLNARDTIIKIENKDFIERKRIKIKLIQNGQIREYNIREICNILNINYETVRRYKNISNTDIFQAIYHYRPDCYINILRELVIPQEDGTKIRLK